MTGVLKCRGHWDTQRKGHVKTLGDDRHPQVKGRGLRRNQPGNTLILDFWPPELGENKVLLFKPSNLGYSATVALENKYSPSACLNFETVERNPVNI